MLVIGFLPGQALDDADFADAGRAVAGRRRLPAAARGPAVHRTTSTCSPGRPATSRPSRSAASGCRRRTTTTPTPGPTYGGRWRPPRGRRCRATTTCWPRTSSTTANAVWLIDYEYSGNNDACFELGNTATECDFTPEQTEAWTEAYFGTPSPRRPRPGAAAGALQRVRLVALGLHPGRHQPDRLRLPRAGGWSASRRPRRPSAVRTSPGCSRMSPVADLPSRAEIVVVGGGVIGARWPTT